MISAVCNHCGGVLLDFALAGEGYPSEVSPLCHEKCEVTGRGTELKVTEGEEIW